MQRVSECTSARVVRESGEEERERLQVHEEGCLCSCATGSDGQAQSWRTFTVGMPTHVALSCRSFTGAGLSRSFSAFQLLGTQRWQANAGGCS